MEHTGKGFDMTTAMMLNFATEFALQNNLSVKESETSRAYIDMLMQRVASEVDERETLDFLRHGAADMERRAD